MNYSKYNIIRKLKDSENYVILNPLSKQADILTPETGKQLLAGNFPEYDDLVEKHYLIDPEEEKRRYNQAYLNFQKNQDTGEVQLLFVPWYSCNFGCSYCYQSDYIHSEKNLSKDVIDSFFNYVEKKFAGKPHYITIFGGEPLLPGKKFQEYISYFIKKAGDTGIAIVTNGYSLDTYLPILKNGNIREIQITIDGPKVIHDKRRPLLDGSSTFDKTAENISLALKSGYRVNLRTVVDRENIQLLPELARYAEKQGWTKYDSFITQLGRNYELHFCQESNFKLLSRLEMYEILYEIIKENPQFLNYHKPAYSVSRFLFENGEMPEPLFNSCPACKTEWAFDYTGSIYSCTATVGKQDEKLGTFYPEIYEDENKIEDWQDRDVRSIDKCRTCKVQLLCGGGCGSVAKNQYGTIHSPDCRPAAELLELGIAQYFQNDKEEVK